MVRNADVVDPALRRIQRIVASVRPSATVAHDSPTIEQKMTKSEKFFFDLNGFIIVRGVLSQEEVAVANAAIDAHQAQFKERRSPELRNTRLGSALEGDGVTGRRDFGGMLGWRMPHCKPFRALLAHPRLVPYLTELCGFGYRLDHLPRGISQFTGSEGFHLHGGPLTSDGRFNPEFQYRCMNGELFNSLLAMSVQLSDHNPGDGGFCIVRGSHKSNFPLPDDFKNGNASQEHLYQPTTRAGDIILFSEATVHGALPWRAGHERRIVLYRFAPANAAYGRSYTPRWPAEMLDGLTPRERAVLEPPYAIRLDRPLVYSDADSPLVKERDGARKAFDKQVFGVDYF